VGSFRSVVALPYNLKSNMADHDMFCLKERIKLN